MGWSATQARPDVLLHYSEDPGIAAFEPHVPRSNPGVPAGVWTIDPQRAPLYWFPRDCPRVAVWANDAEQQKRLSILFTTAATRVQAAPTSWIDAIRSCRLYEYRFDPTPFAPWPEAEGQWIAHQRVVASSVEPAGDLLDRQHAVGVDVRLVDDLAPLRAAVLAAGLPFSIVRYLPAHEPRPPQAPS
jgi:hypothetical protein